MVVHHEADGYEGFCKFVETLPKGDLPNPYIFLFTGSILENGQSWCPDCVEADPVIEAALKNASEDVNFVKITVGNREVWKDSNCPFRKDSRTKLMVIPTLIRWKGPQKLEGEKCAKEELVEMMFQEFDD
ncbi:thioredoxin domain-containing protein 17-like [Arctopsyche grandis]|uniref:thioredoxin domain-containing protein 17-like n=1 Tax=Arctopsyche grandis TaxID=121162 RepID=UPI00406D97AB